MARKRRSNLALAARRAASASTSSLRAKFAAANNRSPISSKISAEGPFPSCAHLGEFLIDFIRTLAGMLEIESDPRGALAQFVSAQQGRKSLRHAVQCGA